eukprot:scaffold2192_cov268-Chaetoceros_neogracile.AAC.70
MSAALSSAEEDSVDPECLYRYPPHKTKDLDGAVIRRYRWAEIKNDPSLSEDLAKQDCTSIRTKANGSRSRPWESMIFFFDKQQSSNSLSECLLMNLCNLRASSAP